MLKLFKSDSSLQILLLFVFGVIMWIPAFITPDIHFDIQLVNVYQELGIETVNSQILVALGFVLLIIETFLVYFLVRENDLGIKKSWFIPLIFLLVNSADTSLCFLSVNLIGNFFVLLAMMFLLLIDQFKNDPRTLLSVSILMGLAFVFQFAYIQFFIVLFIALLILGRSGWRQLQIISIGVVLSTAIYAFAHFMIGDLQLIRDNLTSNINLIFNGKIGLFNLDYTYYIYAFIMFVCTVGLVFTLVSYKDRTILGKKKKNVLVVLLAINIISFLGFFLSLQEFIVISSLAIAFFTGIFWLNVKENRLAKISFFLFIAVFLVNNYIQYFID